MLALNRTLLSPVLPGLFLLTLFTSEHVMAEPIGWMERYALAEDRAAILAELIPGSDDYYFYHCLHFQTVGELERAEASLADWLAQHKGVQTPAITSMIDRQRLLTYEQSPQRTIDHLVRRLGVQLHHSPPPTRDQRRFPSAMDSKVLDVDPLVKQAIQRSDELKPAAMRFLGQKLRVGKTAGYAISLRDYLQRLDGPYVDGLDELVIAELKARRKNELRFGDLKSHGLLTLTELQSVALAVPSIADENSYVAAVLRQMRPDADTDLASDLQERLNYLAAMEKYLQTLPPSYNSMKAAAAFRLLEANLSRGVYDRELLMRYLGLPRVSPIVHPKWLSRSSQQVNLNQDFMDLALLPPVGNEEPVVRAHLEHFLRNAPSPDDFASYLQPEYLRRVFAETKLMAGVGSDAQWYKLLSAAQRQTIRDSIQLRLSPTNPNVCAADIPTDLVVDIKNVKELIVRIYEINTESYFRTHDKPLDTDIDLDGLVASDELTFRYDQPAVVRHQETLRLDPLAGRGVWVIDLVGEGVRARAMIRRGTIDYVESRAGGSTTITAIDEHREPISSATLWVGARQFTSDDHGRIYVPMMSEELLRKAILSDSTLARKIQFQHAKESFELVAPMHLDRTHLQTGGDTELVIRPRLLMDHHAIDPAVLRDVSVQVTATDLEDIQTTSQTENLRLSQTSELVVPVRVPARLAKLEVMLSGKITSQSDGKERTLTASQSWDVAAVRRTRQTHDAFLTRDKDRYVIEVRGRSGETIPGASVRVSMTTKWCAAPVEQNLQSDDSGRIQLGALDGVEQVRYRVVSGIEHSFDLALDQVNWPDVIHSTSDQEIQLPLVENVENAQSMFRLLSTRGGDFHVDLSESLSANGGLLTIEPLAAGDYQLIRLDTGQRVSLAIVDGPVVNGVVTGSSRHRSISPATPLGIAEVSVGPEGWKIQLSGKTDLARVHVYGSRYFDHVMPIDRLALPELPLAGRSVSQQRCGYVSNLRLGDEYQYVLRRRYAKKYAGVMLPSPSVILNPWETEETINRSQNAAAGQAPVASAMAAPERKLRAKKRNRSNAALQSVSSDFDFLADSGVVLSNLRCNDDGVVTIPNDLLEGLSIVHVIACDPVTTIQKTVTSALEEIETVDLRLDKALRADDLLTMQRAVLIASPEQPLDLKNLGTAQVQVYGSVASLWKLYKSLVGDSRLQDFDELTKWHLLDDKAKLVAYSRLASHELHLFLYSHDRTFFDKHIRDYLANKKEKQFVDHWLLGDDLTSYEELWRYNDLSAAERALLAIRVPETRETIRRELREVVEQQDVDYLAVEHQIESALKQQLGFQSGSVMLGGALGGGGMEMADAFADRSLGRRAGSVRGAKAKQWEELGEQEAEDDMDMMFDAPMRAEYAFYRDLDSTKQWAESHWDRLRNVDGTTPKELIPTNAFWSDLATVESDKIPLSKYLFAPIDSRHAALVALAFCGLPLQSGEIGLPTEPGQAYQPEHAVAVVTKRLRKLERAETESSILIGQRFSDANQDDSTRRKSESMELSEFLTGVAYRGQTVLSNPTSEPQVIEVFWQLPAGSLPLAGSQTTDSRTITLQPFAVEAIQYEFYFPQAGEFVHYPATASDDGQLVARGPERSFKVVDVPTASQEVTWQSIANSGTSAKIEAFLKTENLREIDWMLIAPRMRDEAVYRVVVDHLRRARLPIDGLWAYGMHFRDVEAMKVYLSLQNSLLENVGPVLRSSLLDVSPVEQRKHELLEYAPLVRARIHRLGDKNEILNPTFLNQYQSFLRNLSYTSEIGNDDQIVLAYYLLIQNRLEEAIKTFSQIDRGDVTTKIQYDYLDAFLAMHRGQHEVAEKIAAEHANHPIPRWNQRFSSLREHLNQQRDLNQNVKLVSTKVGQPEKENVILEGSGDLAVIDRERRQAIASQAQPEVIVHVEGNSLKIDHRRTDDAILNFYGVDLELLFSNAPFVREDLQRMAMVRPSHRETLAFDSDDGVARFEINESLSRQTLLVEVVAGASRSTTLYFGGDMTTYVSESFGQLQTTDSTTHQPISTAYVKVYGKYPDGDVRFYKDGYTDARGRFDYASVSAADAKGAIRYAILVLSMA